MSDTILKIEKCKDGENRDSLTIEVNNEVVLIPQSIIDDFLNSNHKNIMVTVPD